MSSRLAGVRTRSRQFCERKVFRLGFAGYQVRSRDGVDISEVPFGLQDLIPCRWWMLGGKNGLQPGNWSPERNRFWARKGQNQMQIKVCRLRGEKKGLC